MRNEAESQKIAALIDAEIAAFRPKTVADSLVLADFQSRRRPPRPVRVNFSGGIVQICWSIGRGDGTYRVVYLPTAGYFSLCVESDIGLLDIGVHGRALDCFSSV